MNGLSEEDANQIFNYTKGTNQTDIVVTKEESSSGEAILRIYIYGDELMTLEKAHTGEFYIKDIFPYEGSIETSKGLCASLVRDCTGKIWEPVYRISAVH
jgi:hypothetical protein